VTSTLDGDEADYEQYDDVQLEAHGFDEPDHLSDNEEHQDNEEIDWNAGGDEDRDEKQENEASTLSSSTMSGKRNRQTDHPESLVEESGML
jgi:hypothetical protein